MKFWDNIKKFFSHNDTKTIKEQGYFPLGGGLASTNKYISTMELLTLSYFNRCVEIVANDLASINFNVFKKSKGLWEKDENDILNKLLNKNPNSEMSGFELKKWIVQSLFVYGAAAIYIARDDDGKAFELLPIFRNYINRKVIDGIPRYYLQENIGATESSQENKVQPLKSDEFLPNEDVIWIPYFQIDGVQNVEFRTLYSSILNKIKENDLSTLNAFKNDTGLSLFVKLKNSANSEQKEKVAQSLRDSATLLKQTGMLAFVYDDKMEIESNQKVLQSPISIELRRYVAQELSAMFGIPSSFLGIETPNQSTNQLANFYLDRCLNPILNLIISKIEYSFFKDDTKKEIRYSLIKLSGLDLKDKIDMLSKAINAGILTINETREILGFNPTENGDKLIANGTLQPIDKLGEKVEADIQNLNAETDSIKNNPNKKIEEFVN